jgi:Domain of unknown function (DUF1816)
MKEFFINLLNLFGLAWWVKVVTDSPRCTYYFGPFMSAEEAKTAQVGYLEDLEHEGAQGISVEIGRFKPNDLTVYEEGSDSLNPSQLPAFGGQT